MFRYFTLAALCCACGDSKEDLTEGEDLSTIDSDDDGLTDAQEAELGTDPEGADTDGDGLDDGEEKEEM